MRLNPFSQTFGKRRSSGEPSDADDPLAESAELDEAWPAEPRPTLDPVTALQDIKHFGFARRPDGTLIRDADLEAWPPDHDPQEPARQGSAGQRDDPVATLDHLAPDPLDRGDGIAPGDMPPPSGAGDEAMPGDDDHPLDLPVDRAEDETGVVRQIAQAVDEPSSRGAMVQSAHIDRLRAEIEGGTGLEPRPAADRVDRDGGAPADVAAPPPEAASLAGPPFMAGSPSPDLDRSGSDGSAPPGQDGESLEDVAVTIGRVVSIRGSVVWGALFDDIDGAASRAARMGALVSMRGPESRVFGIVNSLEREQQSGSGQVERTVFEIQILGEIADSRKGFQRGVSSYPPLDAKITTVTLRDIATIYARPRCSNVHIGRLRHNPNVPAFALTDSLLGKHFAILGTTGTGKSCAVTVILRAILDQHPLGHIVMIDPHNEYGAAFADRAELLNPGNLRLPYWLLNFEEIAHILLCAAPGEHRDGQSALLKDAIVGAKRLFAGEQADSQITVDTPMPYRLSDMVKILEEGMGMLNKAEAACRYLGLINRVENLRGDQRYGFMFSSLTVRDNMQQILAQLLRIPTEGKPITIIDISGLPGEIVDVVVSVLFRLTFELAMWSERGKAPPVLLVCEEAHRYVPEEDGVGFAPTKRVISRIAKEGRKYGVTLCLISQRPSEIAVNSLAQCNTTFALRLSNEHDQAFVARALPENARWLVDSLPSLNTREAVVIGDGVTVPVHIRFNRLKPEHRPASLDPSFSHSWSREADDAFLGQAIERWRRQAR